jgi:hypothetical protein
MSELQGGGIKLGDTKYMFLRNEGDSIYGKKGVSIIHMRSSLFID